MQRGTATPIVRPAWNDTVLIKRILDIGAQTLLLPYVQNAEEAQARGRLDALSAAGHSRRRGLRARQPLRPHARLSDQGQRRDLRAGAGRDPRGAARSSKPSPRSTASTACSSGRPICPPRSAISAIRSIPRCRRRCEDAGQAAQGDRQAGRHPHRQRGRGPPLYRLGLSVRGGRRRCRACWRTTPTRWRRNSRAESRR